MFGRRGRVREGRDEDGGPSGAAGAPEESDEVGEVAEQGPWDSGDIELVAADGRLDLGSVRVPIPPGGQIQVEMDNAGAPRAVHLVTAVGRLTVAAFAGPRSPGQWREVAAELAGNLRSEGADVTVEDGPFGREVFGVNNTNAMRFVGVDGPRWMVRCVAAGPATGAEALAGIAHDVLHNTIVVRGDDALPVRTTLPVTLPAVLVQQLAAAQAQAAAQARAQSAAQAQATAQAQQDGAAEPPAADGTDP